MLIPMVCPSPVAEAPGLPRRCPASARRRAVAAAPMARKRRGCRRPRRRWGRRCQDEGHLTKRWGEKMERSDDLHLSGALVSIYLSIYLSICLSIYLSIYRSIYLSILPYLILSIYLSLSISISISISVSISIPISVSISRSISISISNLSVCLTVCLSVCLSVYIYI